MVWRIGDVYACSKGQGDRQALNVIVYLQISFTLMAREPSTLQVEAND